ncbi:Hypothetical protein NTJ_13380 [Nesidiocoris tenuis]|uniref:Uncharacterized protein n=1 Tax=Nesidiocoris tenuis TaxID=355587 RepID=A0ABN7B8F5_9HEMI|nr:Hypothetical protein NTJ_13380 [Nesidiocoris tenuis]
MNTGNSWRAAAEGRAGRDMRTIASPSEESKGSPGRGGRPPSVALGFGPATWRDLVLFCRSNSCFTSICPTHQFHRAIVSQPNCWKRREFMENPRCCL